MKIQSSHYGSLKDGRATYLFTLSNQNGYSVAITNLGGIIVRLDAPDRFGTIEDIALGKASLADYEAGHPSFGSLTGRVAGRISGASFELAGKSYQLEANNGPNCLHGGNDGWEKQIWEPSIIERDGIQKLQLSYQDPDGHNHFPGTIDCTVTYSLLEDNTLVITYQAQTDAPTPFNPTNHVYLNLAGEASGTVHDHIIRIDADSVALADADMTLTGKKAPVQSGLNDLRAPIRIGDLSELTHRNADTHYFLNGGRTQNPRTVAEIYDPKSGRHLELLTTEPGVQFYAATNLSLDAPDIGKNQQAYQTFGAFCLETQDYPDSVHYPALGSALLHPGNTFHSETRFKLSVRDSSE